MDESAHQHHAQLHYFLPPHWFPGDPANENVTDIKFYSKVVRKEKPLIKSVASGKKFENHIRLTNLDELKPGIFLYRESYELV